MERQEIEMNEIKICTAGDSSLLIEFGQEISPEINAQITALVHLIKAQHIEGVTDMIPAFASLLINYDPRVVSYAGLRARLEKLLKLEISGEASESRIFEIPVCYGGEYGPDLQNIADHAGLTPEEVIKIHSSEDYLIYMLGFLPGFSYLGGLDERIDLPIPGSGFRQAVWESEAPRQGSIRWILPEDGSFSV